MSAHAMDPAPQPYAQAAGYYWAAGWRGAVPLPPRAKKSPPEGWTGHKAGAYPSWPDIQTWIDSHHARGNIALRLPRHVVGIDVDDYAGKHGGATLIELEQEWGLLPATWKSTSREGTSGIRLFTVPEGLHWPGNLGLNSGIDVISYRFRYVVAPPSLHPEGRTYRWVTPDGITALPGIVPDPNTLPTLPDAWVMGITKGVAENDNPRADLGDEQMRSWLSAKNGTAPCPRVQAKLEDYLRALRTSSAVRHDIALNATRHFSSLHGEGHDGVVIALVAFQKAWMAALGSSRDTREADREWARLLTGAIELAAVDHQEPAGTDPCEWPTVIDIPEPEPDPLAAPVEVAEDGERLPATWARVDLAPHLDGTHTPPTPTLMPRSDGACLLYRGLTHSMHGESESGKSWVVQAETARCLQEGEDVLYVDFESDAASIVERLLLLGVTRQDIVDHFDYRQPESSPAAPHEVQAWQDMLAGTYTLAVIDGVTDAMGIFGRKVVDNDEIASWMRAFPRRLAHTTGAAVVMIDHVTKDKESRGRFAIGGQAKMASISGAAYVVDVVDVLGKGKKGTLTIRVAKDRPGGVRGKSGPARKADRTQEAARFVLDSTGVELSAVLTAPLYASESDSGSDEGSEASHVRWRPTGYMQKVSEYLQGLGVACTQRNIEQSVSGKAEHIRTAVRLLATEGFVKAEQRGAQAIYYSHLQPYVDLQALGDRDSA